MLTLSLPPLYNDGLFFVNTGETGGTGGTVLPVFWLGKTLILASQKVGDLAGVYGFDVKYRGINHEIAYTICEGDGKKVVVFLYTP